MLAPPTPSKKRSTMSFALIRATHPKGRTNIRSYAQSNPQPLKRNRTMGFAVRGPSPAWLAFPAKAGAARRALRAKSHANGTPARPAISAKTCRRASVPG